MPQLTNIDTRGGADGFAAAGAFVDVSAEKMRGLVAFDPCADGLAAGVQAETHLIEFAAVGWSVRHKDEGRFLFECGKRVGDLLL